MKRFTPSMLITSLLLTGVTTARAGLIPNAIPGVTAFAFQQGDTADPNGDGGVNNVVNGDGLTVGNASDPSTWLHDTAWQTGWQGGGTYTVDSNGVGSALTPGAWFIADLGSGFADLGKLHIWNVREGDINQLNRGARNMDIFHADLPTVTPVTGSAYDFTSGGWASLLTNHVLPQNLAAGADDAQSVIDLSPIGTARYIGFRINSNYNSNFRVGFAEIQFTVVPEPSSGMLLAAGALMLALRRARASR